MIQTPLGVSTPMLAHEAEAAAAILDRLKESDRYWRNAEIEHRLWDDSRVDILTEDLAIEVDWPEKWTEAIGQSVYYAMMTGRDPAVMLLVRQPDREKIFVLRCQAVCERLGIRLFVERLAA